MTEVEDYLASIGVEVKPGVELIGANWDRLMPVLDAAITHYGEHGEGVTITSVLDGVHRQDSKHYIGEGIDLRTYTLGDFERLDVARAMAETLGSDYDVILEADHLHVEYDAAT